MSACLKLSSQRFENNAIVRLEHRHGKATLATVETLVILLIKVVVEVLAVIKSLI